MKETKPPMTLERRSFLKLFGSSLGIITAKNLSYPQRGGKAKAPAVSRKILVAHRGASAYAPEHTFESYQLALKQGADFVEQDLQISRDGILVCLHDLTLERTTNVKDIFPTRFREEPISGAVMRHWYVSDFTLREIKQLDAETKAPEVYVSRGFNIEHLEIHLLKKHRLISRSAARNTPVVNQDSSP